MPSTSSTTFATAPGTPPRLRTLFDAGLDGERVSHVGAADWAVSRSHADEARARGMLLFSRRAVDDRGIVACMSDAIASAGRTGSVHVSFDLVGVRSRAGPRLPRRACPVACARPTCSRPRSRPVTIPACDRSTSSRSMPPLMRPTTARCDWPRSCCSRWPPAWRCGRRANGRKRGTFRARRRSTRDRPGRGPARPGRPRRQWVLGRRRELRRPRHLRAIRRRPGRAVAGRRVVRSSTPATWTSSLDRDRLRRRRRRDSRADRRRRRSTRSTSAGCCRRRTNATDLTGLANVLGRPASVALPGPRLPAVGGHSGVLGESRTLLVA